MNLNTKEKNIMFAIFSELKSRELDKKELALVEGALTKMNRNTPFNKVELKSIIMILTQMLNEALEQTDKKAFDTIKKIVDKGLDSLERKLK